MRSCGVSTPRASLTGANAVTISETGAVTPLRCPSSSQTVRIDSESLPTGMLRPAATHSSEAAFTASKRSASSAGSPQAAIQLAESLIRAIDSIGAAAIFVIASPIAMRADAAASMTATGVRSPIASASPS